MIISQFPSAGSGGAIPYFAYTGDYNVELTPSGWKVSFLSSGTLTMYEDAAIDVFLVGGGGDGGVDGKKTTGNVIGYYYGGGGGGGYVLTQKGLLLQNEASYVIVVGGPGEASSITPSDSSEWSGASYSANGGSDGQVHSGGNGGSGGAAPGAYVVYASSGAYFGGKKAVDGGMNGANGSYGDGTYGNYRGTGSGVTTCEFGDTNGKLYASGGNAYYNQSDQSPILPNTGNGGHGGHKWFSAGASGIVIIRNMHG